MEAIELKVANSRAMAAPGFEVSATFKLEGNHDKGAALFTEAPITRTIVTDDRVLLHWLDQNSKKLIQDHGEPLKAHGIWLISKTYTTRRCALAVFHSKAAEVTVGLEVDISGHLTLAPGAQYSTSGGEVHTAVHEDADDGVVVFMCGILVTKQVWRDKLRVQDRREKQKMLRGGEVRGGRTIVTSEPDGSEAVLVVEIIDPSKGSESGSID